MLKVKTLRHTEAKEKGDRMQTCNSRAECGSGEHFSGEHFARKHNRPAVLQWARQYFMGRWPVSPGVYSSSRPTLRQPKLSPLQSACVRKQSCISYFRGSFCLSGLSKPLSPKPQSLHSLDAAVCLVLDLPGKDGWKLS